MNYRFESSKELNCEHSSYVKDSCPIMCRREECKSFWENTPETPEGPTVDKFKAWEQWEDCSKSCGGGERTRRRECKAPVHVPCDNGKFISSKYYRSRPVTLFYVKIF